MKKFENEIAELLAKHGGQASNINVHWLAERVTSQEYGTLALMDEQCHAIAVGCVKLGAGLRHRNVIEMMVIAGHRADARQYFTDQLHQQAWERLLAIPA